jgi:hypothetical protein
VDDRSIALLEFPAVRERLAAHASFPPSRRLAEALVPESDPVLVARGRSTCLSVEVIVARPVFQRNTVPSATSPSSATDATSGFQLGQASNPVRISQTVSGSAAISASARAMAGASRSTSTGPA